MTGSIRGSSYRLGQSQVNVHHRSIISCRLDRAGQYKGNKKACQLTYSRRDTSTKDQECGNNIGRPRHLGFPYALEDCRHCTDIESGSKNSDFADVVTYPGSLYGVFVEVVIIGLRTDLSLN
jgi:hypothetical protein